MISADERRSTLLTLYPLFKEEVYRRRQEIMRWTAIGSGSLFTTLLVLVLHPPEDRPSSEGSALIASGILVMALTFASLLLQQRHRHRAAKRILIELERALGLFESDAVLPSGQLYPERWQTDWEHDRTVVLALALLALLTLFNLIAIFCRC